ncbi:MAG: serine/threonine-protein kinase [Planctomycetota bacterium]|jgi:hypothetical protein|nr:serine/threonine-protein kinase [Planctomycetota bacterium]
MIPSPLYPDRIDAYTITGVIAEGGMSLVLSATGADGEAVAIKLAEVLDERGRERFRREIEACRRLSHPGIIRIRAAGEYQGRPWYAMDHHGEVTLRELLECNGPGVANELPALIGAIQRREIFPLPAERRRLLPRAAAVQLAISVGTAVAHAHSRGLVHRDLKPENVLLQPGGQPVVVDFGLVADVHERRRLTQTSKVVGTMGYLAPEQFDARRRADERVDVYAMGVILRELLTGAAPEPERSRRPITAAMLTSTRLLRGPGDRPLDRDLAVVLLRASHPDPRWRYRSLQAFVADLQRIQNGEPIVARGDPLWLRLWGLLRRHAAAVSLTLVLLLTVLVLAIIPLWLWRADVAAWAPPVANLSLREVPDLRRLRVLEGAWTVTAAGAAYDGGALAAVALPEALGQDLRLELGVIRDPGPGAAVVIFAAAPQGRWRSGYRLQLAHDNEPTHLYRGARLLALSEEGLDAVGDHRIEWEVRNARHRVRIDGKLIIDHVDPAPLAGGDVGWAQLGPGDVRYHDLVVQAASLQDGADPAQELARLAAVLDGLPPDQRSVLLDAVREAAQTAGVTTSTRAAVLLPALMVARRLPQAGLGSPERLLSAVDERERGDAWWRERMLSLWHSETERALLLTPVVDRSDDPVDLALWLHAAARELRSPAPLAEPASSPRVADARVAATLAAEHYALLPWDGLVRREAFANLRLRGDELTAWLAWSRGEPEDLPERWDESLALCWGALRPESSLAAFLRGREPSRRFAADFAREATTEADRRYLAYAAHELVVAEEAWAWPPLADPAVAAGLEAVMRGEGTWSSWVERLGEAGYDPWSAPWSRLLVGACLTQPADEAARMTAALSLADGGFDRMAGGWALRLVQGQALSQAEAARCASPLASLARILASSEAPTSELRAPPWHPSRPLLELLLAEQARRAGDLQQAQRRLEAVAERPAWPEASVARVLLAR